MSGLVINKNINQRAKQGHIKRKKNVKRISDSYFLRAFFSQLQECYPSSRALRFALEDSIMQHIAKILHVNVIYIFFIL